MTGSLAVTVGLTEGCQGVLAVEIAARLPEAHPWTLEALAVGNGITVRGLVACNAEGEPVPLTVDGAVLRIDAAEFVLRYEVHTRYTTFVGVDSERLLVYPFGNAREVLFGYGVVVVPAGKLDGLVVSLRVEDVPPGFEVFSNLLPLHETASERVSLAGLSNFVVYAAQGSALTGHVYTGQDGHRLALRMCVQAGKALGLPPVDLLAFADGYLRFLEKHAGPYRRADALHILVLQADPDFERLGEGRTFATGENMIGGIAIYGPADGDYTRRVLSAPHYVWALHDGIVHELTHFYTSTSDAAADKSIVHMAESCPAYDRHLIGEALAMVIHRQYLHRVYELQPDRFFSHTVPRWLERQRRTGQRNAHLDLFLF